VKKNVVLNWISAIFLTALTVFLLRACVNNAKLINNHRYTVAITTTRTNGGWVDYEFKVNEVTYKGSVSKQGLKPNGYKYLVKFYTNDPSLLSEIESNDEVLDCIGEPPLEGWGEVPSCK
jgi:hypothetical protein